MHFDIRFPLVAVWLVLVAWNLMWVYGCDFGNRWGSLCCCLAAAHGYKLSGLIIRKEPKGYGTASQVEGPLPPKETIRKGGAAPTMITVLEDVVTTGGSAIKAVNVLRDLGYEVNRVVAIVDRQEGGRDAMIDAGLELHSLFTIEDFK